MIDKFGNGNSSAVCKGIQSVHTITQIQSAFQILISFMLMSLVIILIVIVIQRVSQSARNRVRSPLVNYQYRQALQYGFSHMITSLPMMQKPFILDCSKIILEFVILLGIFDVLSQEVVFMVWALFDQIVFIYAVCLWFSGRNCMEERNMSRSTLVFYGLYSFMFGMPLGLCFKLSSLSAGFPKVQYWFPIFAEILTGPILIISQCCIVRKFHYKWIILGFIHSISIFCIFYCSIICKDYLCGNLERTQCLPLFHSWFVPFMPAIFDTWIIGIIFMFYCHKHGEAVRYMPEIVTLFCWILILATHLVYLDTHNSVYRILQIVWIVISIAVTVAGDTFLVTQLDKANKAAMSNSSVLAGIEDSGTDVQPSVMNDNMHCRRLTEIKIERTMQDSLTRKVKKMDLPQSCPICWEEFRANIEETIGVVQECGHLFHHQCISQWIESISTCPICRVDITVDTIHAISYMDFNRAVGFKRHTGRARTISVAENENNTVEFTRENSVVELIKSKFNERFNITKQDASNLPNCRVCDNKYEDNPQFTVVGCIPTCGHYFHFRCIWTYSLSHSECPACLYASIGTIGSSLAKNSKSNRNSKDSPSTSDEANSNNPGTSGESKKLDVVMTLLANVIEK